MNLKIEFYRHNLGDQEKRSVLDCLDGVFLTTGSYVKEFESAFADYLGTKYAVGLTSCTAALHLSLLALGIGKGDEVITSPMTFIATATAILHTGATPVFVDVEEATGLMDVQRIEEAVNERTKAILPVHLYGQMCDMRKIRKIADKFSLNIVEDSAHCIEGQRDGIKPGQLSDVACFSYYATKNITSGEGGAVATNNEDIARKVMTLRLHGMSAEAIDRHEGIYEHWDMIDCGWKYNMDNIHASLLIPQLKRIDKLWEGRQRLYDKYVDGLKKIEGIDYPKISDNSTSAYHLFTIWVDAARRDSVICELGNRGIGVAVNYRAIHLLKYFREKYKFRKGMFANAEKIGDSTISVPFYPKLSDHELGYILAALEDIMQEQLESQPYERNH